MRIALLSDTHDRIDHLRWFLDQIATQKIDHVFCLGDYCSPHIIEKLAHINSPIFAVWGNNDVDKQSMRLATQQNPNFTWAHEEYGEITCDNKRYFLTHYPELAENAALSGQFAAVFHGHTHHVRNELINATPIRL